MTCAKRGDCRCGAAFSVQCWKVWVKLGKCKDKTVKYLFLNRRRKIQQKNKTTSKRQFISICYFWCEQVKNAFPCWLARPTKRQETYYLNILKNRTKGKTFLLFFTSSFAQLTSGFSTRNRICNYIYIILINNFSSDSLVNACTHTDGLRFFFFHFSCVSDFLPLDVVALSSMFCFYYLVHFWLFFRFMIFCLFLFAIRVCSQFFFSLSAYLVLNILTTII